MKELPLDYRPTLKDMDKGWELLAKYFAGEDLTPDKEYLADLLTDAHYLYQQTGKRPTVADVHDYWQQQREERQRQRLFSWRSDLVLTEKHCAEFDGKLLEDLNELKTKLGRYPSVGEVKKSLQQK